MSTNQSSFPDLPSFETVLEKLQPLLNVVREAIAEGTLHVCEYARWQAEAIDAALAPNLVRHKAKVFLISHGQNAQDDDDEKQVGFETEHIPNNGICTTVPGFVVRTLKSSEDGGVPPPGNSTTRQNFYNQLQALIDFEEFRNGNSHVQPTWGLIVHWTVDNDYTLQKVSVALPLRCEKTDTGKLMVECAFDEPFWTKPPQANVVSIDRVELPRNLDIPGIEEEEKQQSGPKGE